MIKEGFILRRIMGYNIVIDIGTQTKERNGMVMLNDTGAFIFEGLQVGKSIDQVTESLMAEYDVAQDTANADVEKAIADFREAGIIE